MVESELNNSPAFNGALPYLLFIGCIAFGIFFTIKYIPETKNKSLERSNLSGTNESRTRVVKNCPLNQQQVGFYKKNNFIKVKNVFSPELITYFNRVITKKVNEVNQQETPLEGRDTYGKAFLQLPATGN